MSYDLMVFKTDTAPKNRDQFMEWYKLQTEWTEDHSYDDPANTSEELNHWFMEIMESFPAMNGPFANDDIDDSTLTDYAIGREVIYAAFAWSQAEKAYSTVVELAAKHKVGFFDVSGSEAIFLPDGQGNLQVLNSTKKEAKPWWKFW